MKIAIPAEENAMSASVCQSLGRAPFFFIYDMETEKGEFIDNNAATSQGGAGIKAAQLLVDKKTDVILTPRCGGNAAEVIVSAGIKMYKTGIMGVSEAILAFKEGRLSLLEEIHPGLHRHGGQ